MPTSLSNEDLRHHDAVEDEAEAGRARLVGPAAGSGSCVTGCVGEAGLNRVR
jgi:hypothetical protein